MLRSLPKGCHCVPLFDGIRNDYLGGRQPCRQAVLVSPSPFLLIIQSINTHSAFGLGRLPNRRSTNLSAGKSGASDKSLELIIKSIVVMVRDWRCGDAGTCSQRTLPPPNCWFAATIGHEGGMVPPTGDAGNPKHNWQTGYGVTRPAPSPTRDVMPHFNTFIDRERARGCPAVVADERLRSACVAVRLGSHGRVAMQSMATYN